MVSLLTLPDHALETILSYLSFDEISKNRIICRRMNAVCGTLLNRGFLTARKCHTEYQKKVKSLLPRRESERKTHRLARHNEILTAVETKLSILNMSFMKYIDAGLCCFFPGKVIDEIFRVLNFMKKSDCPRVLETLQELRDISSMAVEYFDEKIVPKLEPKLRNLSHSGERATTFVAETLNTGLTLQNSINSKLILKVKQLNRQLMAHNRKFRFQAKQLSRYGKTIADLKHRMGESECKIQELLMRENKSLNSEDICTLCCNKRKISMSLSEEPSAKQLKAD